MRVLTHAGAALDAQDNDQKTALHTAVYQGHADTVRVLIRADAALDVKDKRGKTALQVNVYTEDVYTEDSHVYTETLTLKVPLQQFEHGSGGRPSE